MHRRRIRIQLYAWEFVDVIAVLSLLFWVWLYRGLF